VTPDIFEETIVDGKKNEKTEGRKRIKKQILVL